MNGKNFNYHIIIAPAFLLVPKRCLGTRRVVKPEIIRCEAALRNEREKPDSNDVIITPSSGRFGNFRKG